MDRLHDRAYAVGPPPSSGFAAGGKSSKTRDCESIHTGNFIPKPVEFSGQIACLPSEDRLLESRLREIFNSLQYINGMIEMSTQKLNKTYMAKTGEVEQNWWVVDATDKVVGRLAGDIAMILMGKHRPTYTPHVDTGDYIVVTNVDKVVFTGKKLDQKRYTWYTGWPGLRSETARERMATKPEQVLTEAVRRMLPKNKLGVKMLAKLKVYKSGQTHPHQAQSPQPLELAKK